MTTYKYIDAVQSSVIVTDADGDVQFVPRNHRLWSSLGISDAEDAGEILAYDYEESATVDEAYAAKYAKINTWRDEQYNDESATVTVDDVNYDAGPDSRSIIEGYLAVDYVPDSFTDADNNDITVTLETLQAVQTAILDRISGIHTRQRELKAELETLYTTDDITADEIEALEVGYASTDSTSTSDDSDTTGDE